MQDDVAFEKAFQVPNPGYHFKVQTSVPVTVDVTFKEGGDWWKIIIPGPIALRNLLNFGKLDGVPIFALRLKLDNGIELIYDFTARGWR